MSKNTPTLLKTAAEMRSNGASWAAVGRSVGRSPRTCQQWPRLFRPAWDDVYRDAEARRFTETGGEATAVLQRLLRDGDNKTKLRSADVLLRTRHQRLMREPATAPPRPSQRPSETLGRRRASVSLAQANCLQKQLLPEASSNALHEKQPNPELTAAESPPAVANTPIAVILQAPRAEPDLAELPTPSPTCPAPSKSGAGSLWGGSVRRTAPDLHADFDGPFAAAEQRKGEVRFVRKRGSRACALPRDSARSANYAAVY